MKNNKELNLKTWENVRKDIFTEEEIAESNNRVAKISEELILKIEDEIDHKSYIDSMEELKDDTTTYSHNKTKEILGLE